MNAIMIIESDILPDFPRTRHLPHNANASKGDTIATEAEVQIIFTSDLVTVEEKIDGANTGMCLYDGNPIIRNRNHILNKAFARRRTAAKMQFASIFGWFYEHMNQFEILNNILGFEAAVYGEWMYATHGIRYTKLPDVWIPYDIYDWQAKQFLAISIVRKALQEAGFWTTPLLHEGKIPNWDYLEQLCEEQSLWSEEQREGIYLKINNQNHVLDRFKMVRSGFIQGGQWSDSKITRNIIKEESK